jgi:O-antigen ligase
MKFRSPILWLYMLVASLPFDRIPSTVVWGLRLRPSLVLAAMVILMVALEKPRFWQPRQAATWVVYGFLAVCALSALVSSDPRHGFIITAYTAFVVALTLAVAEIASRLNWHRLMVVFAVSAGIACLFGLYQFGGDLRGLPLSETGLKPAYSGQVFGFPRIQAMSLEPLYFANYLLLPMSLLVGLAAVLPAVAVWPLGVLFVTTLFLTLSRGGVGAMVVMGLLWTGLLLPRRRWRAATGVLTAGLAGMLLTFFVLTVMVPVLKQRPEAKPVLETYTTQVTSYEIGNSQVDRAYTRHMAWQAFMEHPIVGVGPGNYGRYLHARNAAYPITQIANNEPVELLAETGVLGTLLLAGFAGLIAAKGFWVLRKQRTLMAGAGWGLLVYLVAAAVQYYSFSTLYIIHIWLAIGLLIGITSSLDARHTTLDKATP